MPPDYRPSEPGPSTLSGRLDRFDRDVSRRIAVDWPHPRWLTLPLGGLSLSANYGVLWYVIAVLPLVAGQARPVAKLLYVAVAVTLVETLGFVVKRVVGRLRPPIADPTLLRQIPLPISKSFPSSHASMSVAGTLTMGLLYPEAFSALAGLAALICFTRVYLGVHYLGDVLGGLLLGLLVGGLYVVLVPAPV